MRTPADIVSPYAYDGLGERCFTAIDSNRNDVIDFSGNDRITQTTNDVYAAYGTDVSRTRTYVWETPGSSTATLRSVGEASVNGLRSWSTVYRDASTAVASSNWTVYAGSGARYQMNYAADGSCTVSVYQDGRLMSTTRRDSAGTPLSGMTHQYDPHGRTLALTNARNR